MSVPVRDFHPGEYMKFVELLQVLLLKSNTGAGVIGRLGGRDKSMVRRHLMCLCFDYVLSSALVLYTDLYLYRFENPPGGMSDYAFGVQTHPGRSIFFDQAAGDQHHSPT